jgi:hypothetical protein
VKTAGLATDTGGEGLATELVLAAEAGLRRHGPSEGTKQNARTSNTSICVTRASVDETDATSGGVAHAA